MMVKINEFCVIFQQLVPEKVGFTGARSYGACGVTRTGSHSLKKPALRHRMRRSFEGSKHKMLAVPWFFPLETAGGGGEKAEKNKSWESKGNATAPQETRPY